MEPRLKKKLILPGGSGFLGTSFRRFSEAHGYECIVLTRNPERPGEVAWDGRTAGPWVEELRGAMGVVNFTGRSVNCIYSEENRRAIIDSRINSVRIIDEALQSLPEAERPQASVQSASLAIFGDSKTPSDEESPHGQGFSVDVCEQWETAFFTQKIPGVRKCLLRVGFALGPGGGALEPLRALTRGFLGGTVGDGDQLISWLHIDDLNRMFLMCLEDDRLEGTFNATGPEAVTNREFMRAMRHALGRPWSPPAPAWAVKFGARFVMKTEASLALTGRWGVPKRFLATGFQFQHTNLDKSLDEIFDHWNE